ncbi:MAG: hypothetical protein E7269_04765 [Lachnospiraceae bacterium]|nr:hypothetical protein [Lachnospiraceae bacterium]
MMEYFGLTINGKHTSEFGLNLLTMTITQPAPRTNRIQIAGMSGSIDLSEVFGEVIYEDRTGLQFVFDVNCSNEEWPRIYSEIAMWIHGKKCQVIPDDDIKHYYICRLSIDGKKSNSVIGQITITGTAEPFKYDVTASNEDWIWDTFDFETDVIRELADITIDESNNKVVIVGGGMPSVPEFIVAESNELCVIYKERIYDLLVGTKRIPQIRIGSEDITLQFTGSGKLSIAYRGAWL